MAPYVDVVSPIAGIRKVEKVEVPVFVTFARTVWYVEDQISCL